MISILADILIAGSMVSLTPSDQPGIIAETHFRNHPTNAPENNGHYTLTLDGLTVDLTFTWNVAGDADRIVVTPPDGVLCDPSDCTMEVPENGFGFVLLYEWVGG